MNDFPVLSRENSLRCKLTDKNIEEIRNLRELGYSYKYIARVMNVSYRTARIWCLTDEERKQEYKHKYTISPKRKIDMKKIVKSHQRKLKLMPDEVRKWHREYMKNYRKKKKELYDATEL